MRFNQTDFVYKAFTGPVFHTVASERSSAGRPASTSATPASFPNGTNTMAGDPFNPTYFGPINFVHHFPGALSPTA